jgi:hypothetical protein
MNRRGRFGTPARPAGMKRPSQTKGSVMQNEQEIEEIDYVTPSGFRDMVALAFQVSATLEGRPKSCRRLICRQTVRCQLSLENGNVNCGCRPDARTAARAHGMLVFLARVAEKLKVDEIVPKLETIVAAQNPD